MSRHMQRINARYARDPSQANQDAIIGEALRRYHAARITPVARAVRDRGVYMTACQLRNLGVTFIDAYCALFGVMPRHV